VTEIESDVAPRGLNEDIVRLISAKKLKQLVRDEGGTVHRHINIYVNGDAIEALQRLCTPLKDGDEVTIIPAMAGGGR
jgi:molybdopterin converting factor small subunit